MKFSNDENAIYVHHKSGYHAYPKFGDKNINETLQIETGLYGITIFQIKNNHSINFYLLCTNEAMGSAVNWICIGKKDDKWIKYFETNEIRRKYFGDKNGNRVSFSDGSSYEASGGNSIYARTYCKNDTIIMEYRLYEKNITKKGEFRFKWDDKAQWFSVEQVIY